MLQHEIIRLAVFSEGITLLMTAVMIELKYVFKDDEMSEETRKAIDGLFILVLVLDVCPFAVAFSQLVILSIHGN